MTDPRKPVPDNGGDNLKRNPLRGASRTAYIDILVPGFRGRLDRALAILAEARPDVLNHNLETVPRLHKAARPGADYARSLRLLAELRAAHPQVPTKSGLMVGPGESNDELVAVTRDLRAHDRELLTLGQYLQPSGTHLTVERCAHPGELDGFARIGHAPGFRHVASGPPVRSSSQAERRAHGL